MGSSEPEKRTKQVKKIKKRSQELVQNGESAVVASSSGYDDEPPTTDDIEEDAAGVDMKAHKSKKARKNKKKDTLTSNQKNKAAREEEGIESYAEDFSKESKGKSKKAHRKRKDHRSSDEESKPVQKVEKVARNDVYQISSGEEDCSKGMKKWIEGYHDKRPGLKVLQQRIDDFVTAHEEQEEQARREREAEMAEDGWTVVVHRKGGKKTTDPESGVAVGSVAEAAVRDKMAKKKTKDVGLDFYRFQKKEAQRSEIMKLQSKFEEDKKRIQQLRAARKFRPY